MFGKNDLAASTIPKAATPVQMVAPIISGPSKRNITALPPFVLNRTLYSEESME
jgi:hypothetical protein